MIMPSVFTRIVNGEIPCYKVAENEDFLAFLDIMPLTKGHTLVIPKKEVDYIFDLDDSLYVGLMQFSKQVASAIQKNIPCKRIGIVVIGLEVPHAHVHLVPMNDVSDIDFSREKLKLSREDFLSIISQIVR